MKYLVILLLALSLSAEMPFVHFFTDHDDRNHAMIGAGAWLGYSRWVYGLFDVKKTTVETDWHIEPDGTMSATWETRLSENPEHWGVKAFTGMIFCLACCELTSQSNEDKKAIVFGAAMAAMVDFVFMTIKLRF